MPFIMLIVEELQSFLLMYGEESGLPYLQVVETAGEEGYSQYASEVELSNNELLEKLKIEYADIQINYDCKTMK